MEAALRERAIPVEEDNFFENVLPTVSFTLNVRNEKRSSAVVKFSSHFSVIFL